MGDRSKRCKMIELLTTITHNARNCKTGQVHRRVKKNKVNGGCRGYNPRVFGYYPGDKKDAMKTLGNHANVRTHVEIHHTHNHRSVPSNKFRHEVVFVPGKMLWRKTFGNTSYSYHRTSKAKIMPFVHKTSKGTVKVNIDKYGRIEVEHSDDNVKYPPRKSHGNLFGITLTVDFETIIVIKG
jgi:hypothetical protein